MTAPADSRERILARIREALQVPAPKRHLDHGGGAAAGHGGDRPGAESPQTWLPPVPSDAAGQIALFEKNSGDLKTEVVRCGSMGDAAKALGTLARDNGWSRVAAHRFPGAELAVQALETNVTWVDGGYRIPDLESADAGLTGCTCLVAQTGSILVTSASAGGRALSVLPPHHVVIARSSQVVATLADAFGALRRSGGGTVPAFFSFITGPSRTGDIERILVLGAHGPKRLTVLLCDD